ncbi:MAG: bifunctional phosphopantothenoylcysteine decarboxylase/phosphopantothenate--cysteine ligase CoaBC [Candidatus Dormibacteria bacterium]
MDQLPGSDPVPVAVRRVPRALRGRRLVLGVSGGIAAYKAAHLASTLVQGGVQVRVVMTPDARRFIPAITLAALSGRPVVTDLYAAAESGVEVHVETGEWAEAVLVYPATATTLARLAAGRADEALSATVLASDCPLVLAPAMHDRMYAHPAVQDNISRLVSRGALVVEPTEGRLASGRTGRGRLAPEDDVLEAVARALSPHPLAGERILVTAGGTREALDPVRYISNRSSGKMGFALCRAAGRLGAEVTLVTTVLPEPHLPGVRVVTVDSAAEMLAALEREWTATDVLLMAAAVADYRPDRARASKRPKSSGPLNLELVPNPDLVATLAARPGSGQRPFLVGFAAETGDLESKARGKLERKGLDLVVANEVGEPGFGMGSDFNQVTVLAPDGRAWQVERAPKDEIADAILGIVVEVRATGSRTPHSPRA